MNKVTGPVSINKRRDPLRLGLVAYWFVPAAMMYAAIRYGEAGWGITGRSFSYELAASGILLQGWLPVAATWGTRRTGAGLSLFVHLVFLQVVTGIAMATLYVLMLIITTGGANPWQGVSYYAQNPGVPLTIAMVTAFSWALMGIGMLVGAATRKALALWPATIMAAVLALAYLSLWWGRLPNPTLLDFQHMQYAWFGLYTPSGYVAPDRRPLRSWGRVSYLSLLQPRRSLPRSVLLGRTSRRPARAGSSCPQRQPAASW